MISVDFSLFESDLADVPAKFGDHRSYINGDINSYISSYMETLEKAKPTASVRNIGRFLKSWIKICNFKVPDTAGTKKRKRRRKRLQIAGNCKALRISRKRKKKLLLELNTITKFLLFRMKYSIDGVFLFDNWYFVIFTFLTDT